jgi:hypothetical protein
VVVDIPRDVESVRWPWAFMEELKNGRMTCSKYQGGIMKFKRPNVVLFANHLPDISKHLSKDRIKVMMLSPHDERTIAHLSSQGGGTSVEVSNISVEKPWPDWGHWARELQLEPTRDDRTLVPIPPVTGTETNDPPVETLTQSQDEDNEAIQAIDEYLEDNQPENPKKRRHTEAAEAAEVGTEETQVVEPPFNNDVFDPNTYEFSDD